MSSDPKSNPAARERELFLGALEKPVAERAGFLDAVCGTDDPLRERVEQLLREEEEIGGFMETPAMSGALPRSGLGSGGTELIAS
ncbi:MAG TPA: hypothetical protein VK615_10875, partial [Candidatus Binatia bacterium]|nr:hypothetical protein [Candidatus Binatia bacterium]